MKTPSISIIIPVYNVSKYLRICLDSVINQTKADIEIICVNDGSTDTSLSILQKYAQRDTRIVIIDQKNGGLGKAYNAGLDIARGKYIGFVEPDDFIALDMYEKLFEKIEIDNSDIVRGQFLEIDHLGQIITGELSIKHTGNIVSKPTKPLSHPGLFLYHPAIWTCLYRTEMIHTYAIRFLESPGASFQDLSFWFDILAHAKTIVFVDSTVYYYRKHTGQSVAHLKVQFWIDVYAYIDKTLEKIKIEDKEKYDTLKLLRLQRSIGDYMWGFSLLDKKGAYNLCKHTYNEYGNGAYDTVSRMLPISTRIRYILMRYNLGWVIPYIMKIKIFL